MFVSHTVMSYLDRLGVEHDVKASPIAGLDGHVKVGADFFAVVSGFGGFSGCAHQNLITTEDTNVHERKLNCATLEFSLAFLLCAPLCHFVVRFF